MYISSVLNTGTLGVFSYLHDNFHQMSGLGEVLAGVAAVASVSQLLVYVLQMSQTLATFYNEMENAPSEINRVQQRLAMLHSGLAFFKASLTDLTDEAILPLELKTLLESALRKVYNIIIEMQQKCLKKVDKEPHRFGSRFRFAWRDHASTVKLLNQLQEAEMDLLWFTQLLNM
jgi:DNA repair ATPase RecN